MKIAHIINPVDVLESSDLFVAQPVTFETMRRAKTAAKEENDLSIELYFTCYEEDLSVAPDGFTNAGLLEKSVLDYGTFSKKRKLPIIKDILDRPGWSQSYKPTRSSPSPELISIWLRGLSEEPRRASRKISNAIVRAGSSFSASAQLTTTYALSAPSDD